MMKHRTKMSLNIFNGRTSVEDLHLYKISRFGMIVESSLDEVYCLEAGTIHTYRLSATLQNQFTCYPSDLRRATEAAEMACVRMLYEPVIPLVHGILDSIGSGDKDEAFSRCSELLNLIVANQRA